MDERADALDAIDEPLVVRPPREDRAEGLVEQPRRRRRLELREPRVLGDEPRHQVLQHLERRVLGELVHRLGGGQRRAGRGRGLGGHRNRLLLAHERPGEHRVELRGGEETAERARLLPAARGEPIVVDLTVRRLTVADEEQGSHAHASYLVGADRARRGSLR